MFSHPMPVYCLFRGPVGLDSNDTFFSSSKTKQQFGRMSTSLCSEEWLSEDSARTHESCFSDRDHACPTSLQRSPALTPTSSGPVWPWEESDNPFNLPGPGEPGVVGLREQTSEWLSNLTSSGPVWPWEKSDNPFNLSGPGEPGVVGLREQTSEWLSNLTPPC